MPLTFQPSPGDILVCDYTSGFRPPEMVKVRPVIVVSKRVRSALTCVVVPLSSTAPEPAEPWHVPVPPGAYPPARGTMWAKCDMVNAVAYRRRLDRVRVRQDGRPAYTVPKAPPDFLDAVRAGVAAYLGAPLPPASASPT